MLDTEGETRASPIMSCCSAVLRSTWLGAWPGMNLPPGRHQAFSTTTALAALAVAMCWLSSVITWTRNVMGTHSLPCDAGTEPRAWSQLIFHCSDLGPIGQEDTVTCIQSLRKSRASRGVFPLEKPLRPAQYKMLSCVYFWVKKQVLATYAGVSASETIGGLKWQLSEWKQNMELRGWRDICSQ